MDGCRPRGGQRYSDLSEAGQRTPEVAKLSPASGSAHESLRDSVDDERPVAIERREGVSFLEYVPVRGIDVHHDRILHTVLAHEPLDERLEQHLVERIVQIHNSLTGGILVVQRVRVHEIDRRPQHTAEPIKRQIPFRDATEGGTRFDADHAAKRVASGEQAHEAFAGTDVDEDVLAMRQSQMTKSALHLRNRRGFVVDGVARERRAEAKSGDGGVRLGIGAVTPIKRSALAASVP